MMMSSLDHEIWRSGGKSRDWSYMPIFVLALEKLIEQHCIILGVNFV
jgi:hypothetical protein